MIRNRDGTLNVEMLVAYADGTLTEPDRVQTAAALAADAEAARTIAALRESAMLAARAFDDLLAAPVPDRLIAAATGRRTVVPSEAAVPPAVAATNDNWRRIAAASVVALLLLAAGYAGGRWTADHEGAADLQPAGVITDGIEDPAALGALHALLSDAPATGRATEYEGGTAVLDAPLALVDGDICWQFTVMPAGAATLRGIACPESSGGWTLMSRGELP